jgi:hypothetical protein
MCENLSLFKVLLLPKAQLLSWSWEEGGGGGEQSSALTVVLPPPNHLLTALPA